MSVRRIPPTPQFSTSTCNSTFAVCAIGPLRVWACLLCLGLGCKPTPPPVAPSTTHVPATASLTPAQDQKIRGFCGDCHAFPRADYSPRAAWHEEVQRGFGFYEESERVDLDPPPLQQVTQYFHDRAPEQLTVVDTFAQATSGSLKFSREDLRQIHPQAETERLAVAGLHWLPRVDQTGHKLPGHELLSSDMRRGEVLRYRLEGTQWQITPLAQLKHPARICQCDLDGNGTLEYLVADLGSFLPAEHDQGGVAWLVPAGAEYEVRWLLQGVGRVCDVQVGDWDADGDQDVLVGEFGWRKTGGIHWLQTQGLGDGQLQVHKQTIDPRSGVLDLIPTDLDGDGQLDFIAALSQHHEVIMAYRNQGAGVFRPEVLSGPYDPAYGSSGIQLVDFDGDGDNDLLYTNGDTFDSFDLKPYHGLQWLENQGQRPYRQHHIAAFSGTHRALAVDLDQDGDQDVVAISLLPQRLLASTPQTQHAGLVWFEQTSAGHFEPHPIAWGAHHATLVVEDFDGDGDVDLAVGSFDDQAEPLQNTVTVWWNSLRNTEKSRATSNR